MLRALALLFPLAVLASPASAGDLRIRVTPGGDVVILGDADDNVVSIGCEDACPELRTNGTINGEPGTFELPEPLGRLYCDLGDGDDAFSVQQAPVAREVRFVLGAGDDSVNLETGGDVLEIDMGRGDDRLYFEATGYDRTRIRAGAGRDSLRFFGFYADSLDLRAGPGDDLVSLDACTVTERCALNGGGGGADALELFESSIAEPARILGFESGP